MGGPRYERGGAMRGSRKGDTHFTDFGAGYTALQNSTKFFSDNSNSDIWAQHLDNDEYHSVKWYTGTGYNPINKALYTTDYDDMDPSMQQTVDKMNSAMEKFVLTKGIQVTRQCDFKIFGAESGKKMSEAQVRAFLTNPDNLDADGNLLNKGALSFGANNHGAAIDGSGLVIHCKVPPSIGAGAYVNPISTHAGASENGWLFNHYALFKFDPSSITTDWEGKIHVNAVWTGREDYRKKHKSKK